MLRHGVRGPSSDSPGWLETDDDRYYGPIERELLFGDWMPGRFAWEFANMRGLSEPIPAKGGQRIWNWQTGGGEASKSRPMGGWYFRYYE